MSFLKPVSLRAIITHELPLLSIGFMIALLFSVLYFLYSRLLGDKTLEQKARKSITTPIETAFLIAFILFIEQILASIFNSLAGVSITGSITTHINYALISLNQFEFLLTKIYMSMWFFDIVLTFLYGSIISLSAPTLANSFMAHVSIFGVLAKPVDLHNLLSNQIFILLALVHARTIFLVFSQYLVAALLPIGLFMRFFSPLKKSGSSIIALMLAIYFIFPYSVVFSDYLMGISNVNLYNSVSTSFLYDKNHGLDRSFFSTTIVKGNPSSSTTTLLEKLDETYEIPMSQSIDQEDALTGEETLEKAIGETTNSDNNIYTYDPSVFKFSFFKDYATNIIGSKNIARFTEYTVSGGIFYFFGKLLGWIGKYLPGKWGSFLKYTGFILKIPLLLFYMKLASFGFVNILLDILINEIFLVGKYYVLMFVFLIFEVTLTVVGYRAISKLLGGETTLLGLTKVI